ncbi:YtxH domain-containing protein [Plebeiibacterium marinum]|uniref:YtxH domain-containing protein n=1 Tax=Plebeiibacterium marinum TaxID=2992111 RepID=A0AAE3SM67_9BACT|nr:YtxH domain-containing protein [Plebeiobacterium marinum]MCW3807235.1 YtxH domain-containing protein [Plebeiobacterium marinum]
MRNSGLFFGGMIAGAILGAGTALLFAPQKGSETRDQLKQKLNDLEKEMVNTKEKLKVKGGELKEELKTKIHNIEEKIEKLLDEYKKTLEPTSSAN